MLNAGRLEFTYDDFTVWRGIERRCFVDMCEALLPNFKLRVYVESVRVHDLTLSELNAREELEAGLVASA